MTTSEGIEILIRTNIEYFKSQIPAGLGTEDALKACIEWAYGDQLDAIGEKYFGLSRQGGIFMVGSNMGASDPERDTDFRDRILCSLLGMGHKMPLNRCTHVWKLYQGFTQTYEYCTYCDEKKL